MGLDEYDVADELARDRVWQMRDQSWWNDLRGVFNLQARNGYVNKGLNLDKIKLFPQMTKSELKKFLKSKEQNRQRVHAEISDDQEDEIYFDNDGRNPIADFIK